MRYLNTICRLRTEEFFVHSGMVLFRIYSVCKSSVRDGVTLVIVSNTITFAFPALKFLVILREYFYHIIPNPLPLSTIPCLTVRAAASAAIAPPSEWPVKMSEWS